MSAYPSKEERRDARRVGYLGGRWIAVIVIVAVVACAVIGLAWKRYYGRTSLDIDARNRRASFERQDTDRAEIVKLWDQYTATDPADTTHRRALMSRMCMTYGEVRGSLGNYPDITAALADCP